MRRFPSRFLFLILLITSGFFIHTPSVNACSLATSVPNAPTPIPYTFSDHAHSVDYVLVGTVIGGTRNNFGYLIDAEVQVEYYLKGEGSEIVIIDDFGWLSNCDRVSTISVGQEYIFFATGNEFIGRFQLQRYLGRAGVNRVEETIISDIFTKTNQSLEPYPMPLNQQIQRATRNDEALWILISFISSIFVLLGLTIFKIRRGQRKSKLKR